MSMIVHLDIRFPTLIVFLYLLHTSSSALHSLLYVYFALDCCPVSCFHFRISRKYEYICITIPTLYFRSAGFEWTSVSCSISHLICDFEEYSNEPALRLIGMDGTLTSMGPTRVTIDVVL